MLSSEDQQRLAEIERHLRTTDPGFAALMRDKIRPRRDRLLLAGSILLWAAVPALTVIGGWLPAMGATAALALAGLFFRRALRP